ncbi:MAG TPA: hypothetical protein VND65_09540 [Candidatus Binatia bacterium]|nr:hypothetical protein [Candidatus Binatia bacterium]
MDASPTLAGFRLAFRRPAITFAEIAWRWSVAAVAWAAIFFGAIEYLNTLTVSNSDAALLGTKQPVLAARAIQHILRGNLTRAGLALVFAAFALCLLWVLVASIGRFITLRSILAHFQGTEPPDAGSAIRALILLNFLRAAVALGAALSLAGAGILARLISPGQNPQPALSFAVFVPLAALIFLAWSTLNWLLSLASLFAVRDGLPAFGSISAASDFCQAHTRAVLAVSTWTGVAHLIALSGAMSVALVIVQIISVSTAAMVRLAVSNSAFPGRVVILALALVALGYSAVADWIFIARFAGYAFIVEFPAELAQPAASPTITPAASNAVDRDEPILSDLPGLAPG